MLTSRLKLRVISLVVIALGVAATSDARAQSQSQSSDPDPWFGRDKFYHFTASALIASTTYAIASTQFHARYPPILIGAGVSISIGAGKETLDAFGFGDPSWKDFAWDVIGTMVGIGCAWAVDLAARPVSTGTPYFGDP